MTNLHNPNPLAEVFRGTIVESIHSGHIAVVDGSGNTIAGFGHPQQVTFLRSSAKPFQAIPLISSGAAKAFRFTPAEIAIACASHNGEPIHTQTVSQMLDKIELSTEALACGIHPLTNKEVAAALQRDGLAPSPLHNNCSGKHAGMLAVCRHEGFPLSGYVAADHPLQRSVRQIVSLFADVSEVPYAIDGCGVPTFGLSLHSMARMFARYIAGHKPLGDSINRAAQTLTHCITSHPEMIAGPGELDTELMKIARGKILSKGGAEGVWCAGILPSSKWATGLGIALKVSDGSSRARSVIALDILRQLQVLNEDDLESLLPLTKAPIANNRGETVGEIRSCFKLNL